MLNQLSHPDAPLVEIILKFKTKGKFLSPKLRQICPKDNIKLLSQNG